jgi:hypothetical protein
MNDGIKIDSPVDRYGRIRPVIDTDYVGQPVVGYVVRMEDGFYAIADRDDCRREESITDAASYVAHKWRGRK